MGKKGELGEDDINLGRFPSYLHQVIEENATCRLIVLHLKTPHSNMFQYPYPEVYCPPLLPS